MMGFGRALEGLSEVLAESVDCVVPVVGCFVLGVDVVKLVDCDSKLWKLELDSDLNLMKARDRVRVTDGTPCVCEIVFEVPSELAQL